MRLGVGVLQCEALEVCVPWQCHVRGVPIEKMLERGMADQEERRQGSKSPPGLHWPLCSQLCPDWPPRVGEKALCLLWFESELGKGPSSPWARYLIYQNFSFFVYKLGQ